jgi:hypothetical protein
MSSEDNIIKEWIAKVGGIGPALIRVLKDFYNTQSGSKPWDVAPGPAPEPEPIPNLKADQKGADGFMTFKAAGIQTNDGVNPGDAIDGKHSTFFEGKNIQFNLGGVGLVRTVGLKLVGSGTPERILTNPDILKSDTWTVRDYEIVNGPEGNGFTYLVLNQPVATSAIRIESEDDQITIRTMQIYEIEVKEEAPIPPTDPIPIPGSVIIPAGFKMLGAILGKFVHWGRYETGYNSGGEGPSQRWGNKEANKLNMVAGFDYKIGPDHGKRGDDEVSLKFPRCITARGTRLVYIPSIEWFVDGRNAVGKGGKEHPHPDTNHDPFNKENPKPQVGNIKDGQWHSFLAACYNDPANNNAITIKEWVNPKANGKWEDYIYLGCSIDGTGGKTVKPGPPAPFSAEGHSGGTHEMQIRIDEIPRDQLQIRNPFAVEVVPPNA